MYMGRSSHDTRSLTLSDNDAHTIASLDFPRQTSLRGIQFAIWNDYQGAEVTKVKALIYVQIIPNGRWVNITSFNPIGVRNFSIVSIGEIPSFSVASACLDDMAICGFRVDVQRTSGAVSVPVAIEFCAMDSKEGF